MNSVQGQSGTIESLLARIATKTPEELLELKMPCPCRNCAADRRAMSYFERILAKEKLDGRR